MGHGFVVLRTQSGKLVKKSNLALCENWSGFLIDPSSKEAQEICLMIK